MRRRTLKCKIWQRWSRWSLSRSQNWIQSLNLADKSRRIMTLANSSMMISTTSTCLSAIPSGPEAHLGSLNIQMARIRSISPGGHRKICTLKTMGLRDRMYQTVSIIHLEEGNSRVDRLTRKLIPTMQRNQSRASDQVLRSRARYSLTTIPIQLLTKR